MADIIHGIDEEEGDFSCITITFDEYYRLVENDLFLDLLHDFGVEDWEGYQETVDKLNEILNETEM